jgi:hypothetical protein
LLGGSTVFAAVTPLQAPTWQQIDPTLVNNCSSVRPRPPGIIVTEVGVDNGQIVGTVAFTDYICTLKAHAGTRAVSGAAAVVWDIAGNIVSVTP